MPVQRSAGFAIPGSPSIATRAGPAPHLCEAVVLEEGRDITVLNSLLLRARRTRWAQVTIANLRIFVGFAFVPSGLKKVLGEPFTDPHLRGPFHEFLHAFHATGAFYQFVGVMQLVTATLLITQRFATIGALFATPILTTIMALCWSTKVYPTATVVTLMWLGTIGLVVWDWPKWCAIFDRDEEREARAGLHEVPIDRRLWQACGVGVLSLYLAVCVATGGVYRPRGVAWNSPRFYVFPAMLVLVVATFILDQARCRRARRARETLQARGPVDVLRRSALTSRDIRSIRSGPRQ